MLILEKDDTFNPTTLRKMQENLVKFQKEVEKSNNQRNNYKYEKMIKDSKLLSAEFKRLIKD